MICLNCNSSSYTALETDSIIVKDYHWWLKNLITYPYKDSSKNDNTLS